MRPGLRKTGPPARPSESYDRIVVPEDPDDTWEGTTDLERRASTYRTVSRTMDALKYASVLGAIPLTVWLSSIFGWPLWLSIVAALLPVPVAIYILFNLVGMVILGIAIRGGLQRPPRDAGRVQERGREVRQLAEPSRARQPSESSGLSLREIEVAAELLKPNLPDRKRQRLRQEWATYQDKTARRRADAISDAERGLSAEERRSREVERSRNEAISDALLDAWNKHRGLAQERGISRDEKRRREEGAREALNKWLEFRRSHQDHSLE